MLKLPPTFRLYGLQPLILLVVSRFFIWLFQDFGVSRMFKNHAFFQKMRYASIALPLAVVVGCGGGSGGSSNDDEDPGTGDQTGTSSHYSFESQFAAGESAVAYSGQTTRHLLIEDLVAEMKDLTDTLAVTKESVIADLDKYIRGEGDENKGIGDLDGENYNFSRTDETLIPGPTFGDISGNKNLAGKIAGGYINELVPELAGESSRLLSEFIGWNDGLDSTSTPLDLVDLLIDELATGATDGEGIAVPGLADTYLTATVSATGRDYRQLIQKFLLGAVTYSQGTADYLKTDFATKNAREEANDLYTEAEHKWDEAFGYFGAARDFKDYTDADIRAAGQTEGYQNGYHDTNDDGDIDLRSEINLGNSTNCAKRDLGTVGKSQPTDYTTTAFDAFLAGRKILNDAAANEGDLSQEQVDALNEQILIASLTWEKCIAATVIHYINDVRADLAKYSDGEFVDVGDFEDVAKHWSEMKGFALGLQFNPDSPYRASAEKLEELKNNLEAMGDAPVLPDGSQNGVQPVDKTAAEAVQEYSDALLSVRDNMEATYGFNAENVEDW